MEGEGARVSSTKSRREFTVDEKVAILRSHLVDKVAVLDLCEQHHIQPSVFCVWQRRMWLNLEAVFETSKRSDCEAHTSGRGTRRLVSLRVAVRI